MEVTWTIGDTPVASFRRDQHKVHYSGQLDSDCMSIAGRWIIRHSGLIGRIMPPQSWGKFELCRKS
jgi:hypothetical protein